jgi:predicted transcriptional regulator
MVGGVHGDYQHLGPWLNEPSEQDKVVAFLTKADAPALCAEVADACDMPLARAAKILNRLHRKGVVTRHKIPIQRRNRNGWASLPCFIYTWVEGGDA